MLRKQLTLVDFDIYALWPNPPYDPCPVQSIYASSVMATVLQSANTGRVIDSTVNEVFKNMKTITVSNISIDTGIVSSIEEKRKPRSFCRNYSDGSTVLLTFNLFVKYFNLQNIIFLLSLVQ